MAFDYFSKQRVDIAIIETGLGGRLDSTNIITPELSIITNIGYDHMNLLGDTLEEIAAEKAGIIKPGVPVIISELRPETKPYFEYKAGQTGADIVFAAEKKWIADWHIYNNYLHASVAESELGDQHKEYILDLPGVYQLKNLLAVLQAVNYHANKRLGAGRKNSSAGIEPGKKINRLAWQMGNHTTKPNRGIRSLP